MDTTGSHGPRLLSIVVPVYNEEGNVRPLYQAVLQALEPIADRYELEFVFTDNHSSDATFQELRALAQHDHRVRVFRFSRNFGFQRSIQMGYRLARGAAAVQIDCDLQDPPALILEFVKKWEEGSKVVYGVRRSRREGFLITAARRLFYRMIDALSEDRLPHDAGDFRLIDRIVLDALRSSNDHRPYLRGTLAVLGFTQTGVPYDRAARTVGKSKFRLRDLIALAVDGILSHSTVPLRLATYTGLFVSLVTFTGLIAYAAARLFLGVTWPAGFATTTTLILLSLSLNSLFLGVIGEYLGRIYHQVRKQPLALIEEHVDLAAEQTPERATEVPSGRVAVTRSGGVEHR
jgi:dolichol-phosphate mannosyltransferase